MEQFVQLALIGVALGSVYSLVALGFILVHEGTGVVNFATGQFVMVGCFLGISTVVDLGLPIVPGWGLALIGMILFAGVFYGLAFRPLRHGSAVSIVIGTVGIGIILQNVGQLLWGSLPQRPPSPLGDGKLTMAGMELSMHSMFSLVVTVLLIGAVHIVLYHTMTGARMRAVAQDRDAARLMAIPVERILLLTWIIASLLMGVAGLLLGPLWFADVAMGDPIALKAFAAAIIGGFGSIGGALFGGIAVGLAEVLSSYYLTSTYKDAIVFLLMIAFLVVRPEGIFRGRISERG